MLVQQAAKTPAFYFIGVTTGQSSIMKVFPRWAKALGLQACIKGIDLPLHAPEAAYRKTVKMLKEDPLALGALVTTHKLDLFHACRDLFDFIDPFAEKLQEVSSLSKRDGLLRAHAKDPISSGLALESFVPPGYWRQGGEVLLLGSGGSSLAMSLYFSQQKFGGNVPRRITITNRSIPRLQSAKAKLAGLNPNIEFRFVHCPTPADNDKLVARLPPRSLVVRKQPGVGNQLPGRAYLYVSGAGPGPKAKPLYRGWLELFYPWLDTGNRRGIRSEN